MVGWSSQCTARHGRGVQLIFELCPAVRHGLNNTARAMGWFASFAATVEKAVTVSGKSEPLALVVVPRKPLAHRKGRQVAHACTYRNQMIKLTPTSDTARTGRTFCPTETQL